MSGLVGALAAMVTHWLRRSRSRGHLAGLDARLLDDIGIDRAKARREAGKFPWQA